MRLMFSYLLIQSLALVPGYGRAPDSFDTPYRPAWFKNLIENVNRRENVAAAELSIAIYAMLHAEQTLDVHIEELERFTNFPIDKRPEEELKRAVLEPLLELRSNIQQTVDVLLDQHYKSTPFSKAVVAKLTHAYKQTIQAAELCELIAVLTTGQVTHFFRELHAVIYRSLGLRHFLNKLTPVFTDGAFDKFFRLSEIPQCWFTLNRQARQVAHAYRGLKVHDNPQLSFYSAPAEEIEPDLLDDPYY